MTPRSEALILLSFFLIASGCSLSSPITWLCMFPASRWPFYCLHLLGKIHRLLHSWLQIIMFYCDEHLSFFFLSFLKLDLHMNQKISAMNVCSPEGFSTAHRHEHLKWISSLKLDALFLGCWSKKEKKKKRKGTISFRRALLQAILFFYWKCSVWMFCARVKWHFNTTECLFCFVKQGISLIHLLCPWFLF